MQPFPVEYELPPSLIAQEPCEPRDHARLLVTRRDGATLEHRNFFELPELLNPGDLLVLNNTKVLHARLLGKRATTGGHWEGLYVAQFPDGDWELMCQTRGKLVADEIIAVEPGPFALRLVEKLPTGRWKAKPMMAGSAAELLEKFGQVPLPPYIRKGEARPDDHTRYQTIYAEHAGAVAAPTAGLHFTPRVLAELAERGIDTTFVTLHVGLGTFQPIQVDDYTQHAMHEEWGQLDADAARKIAECRRRGGRVVAVGTTSVRVLETVAQLGPVQPWSGRTNLYIRPPYRFGLVDALVTNFHLPRTTLLLMVAAFAGVELTRRAYEVAIAEHYRFYSYGDAMLIV